MTDREFAIYHYGYPQPLKCEQCGRIIYNDDDYKKSGYGGFLCSKCKKDYEEEEDE